LLFFPDGPKDPVLVSESLTKESLTKILDEYKYLGVSEFKNDNFLALCGRKSTKQCFIAFTSPKSTHFSATIATLKGIVSSYKKNEVKVGWVDAVKYPQFADFFNIPYDKDKKQGGGLLLNARQGKYFVAKDEIIPDKFSEWLSGGEIAYVDLPKNIPSLVELPDSSVFSSTLGWISAIIRFCLNNLFMMMIVTVFLLRLCLKDR